MNESVCAPADPVVAKDTKKEVLGSSVHPNQVKIKQLRCVAFRHIYNIYIHIYICVCLCVYYCIFISSLLYSDDQKCKVCHMKSEKNDKVHECNDCKRHYHTTCGNLKKISNHYLCRRCRKNKQAAETTPKVLFCLWHGESN